MWLIGFDVISQRENQFLELFCNLVSKNDFEYLVYATKLSYSIICPYAVEKCRLLEKTVGIFKIFYIYLFVIYLSYLFMCISVLPACIYVYHVHAWCPKKALDSLELDAQIL